MFTWRAELEGIGVLEAASARVALVVGAAETGQTLRVAGFAAVRALVRVESSSADGAVPAGLAEEEEAGGAGCAVVDIAVLATRTHELAAHADLAAVVRLREPVPTGRSAVAVHRVQEVGGFALRALVIRGAEAPEAGRVAGRAEVLRCVLPEAPVAVEYAGVC